jgi:magnesium chelatase family protein
MLARQLATMLPPMTLAEALETTRIHRVAGLTDRHTACVTSRPCRAPHHTISGVGVIGGGQIPMPGEVSLAHHGILFLDELPEFTWHVSSRSHRPDIAYRLDRVSVGGASHLVTSSGSVA